MGNPTSAARKAQDRAHVGRLRQACLTCRESAGNLGLRVRRGSCEVHGTGDHVRRVRV